MSELLEQFCVEDAKEGLAELFFQCARYERPSTDWKEALEFFCGMLIAKEREACAKACESEDVAPSDDAIGVQEVIAAKIRMRSNVLELSTLPPERRRVCSDDGLDGRGVGDL